jgi:hypothetical protein
MKGGCSTRMMSKSHGHNKHNKFLLISRGGLLLSMLAMNQWRALVLPCVLHQQQQCCY